MRIELPLQQVPSRDEDKVFDDGTPTPRGVNVRRYEVEATATSARTAEELTPERRGPGSGLGSFKRLRIDVDDATEFLELEYEEIDSASGQRRDIVVLVTPDNLRRPSGALREGNAEAALGDLLLRPDSDADRGGSVRAVLRALKVLRLESLGADAARLAASKFEELTLGGDTSLRRCPTPGALGPSVTSEPLDASKPILILVHGTAASTASSFGDLDGTAEWQELFALYRENLLAFDHRTLTQDPVDNAMHLLGLLPSGAKLHLLSHSRGGLVGDLLTLATSGSEEGDIARKVRDPDFERRLADLRRLGLEKKIRVERFLRCACPARGTALMTSRLDAWASLFLTLLGFAFKGNPIYAATRKLLLNLVGLRTDARTLPGLACMAPDSNLLRYLNTQRLSQGELAIIAGDARRPGLLGRLRTLLVDAFFREQNDLIVDTDSMYGGAVRPTTRDMLLQDAATTPVNHFIYFKLRDVRSRILDYVARGDVSAFEPAATELSEARGKLTLTLEAMGVKAALTQPPRRLTAPIVIVLPGIMGTHLRLPTGRVWLNFWALAAGGLTDLRADAKDVRPDALLTEYYGELTDYLARQNRDVVLFPYDWRAPLQDSADKLVRLVNSLRASPKRPIRLLAHSMGGLVARTMIRHNKTLWQALVKDHDTRLLMLGTPNAGSHTIAQLFTDQHQLMKLIAHVDSAHNGGRSATLSQVARGFAGAVQMLPEQVVPELNFFDPELWSRVKLPTPDAAPVAASMLEDARKLRDELVEHAIDPQRMFYVAGTAAYTPSIAREADGALKFTGTREGDSTVTWASGRLEGVKMFYAQAEHADLANFPGAFDAYLDLLDFGSTERLPDAPPVGLKSRDGAVGVEELPPPELRVDLFPGPADFANAALGRSARPRYSQPESRVHVSVAHGDARSIWEFREPGKNELGTPLDPAAPSLIVICLGHGEGPPHPEAELDALVGRGIQRQLEVGTITGRLHTRVIVRSNVGAGPNVLVLGVGDVRNLATADLVEAFSSALLEACLNPALCTRDAASGVRFLRPVLALARIRRAGYTDTDILTVGLLGVVQANRRLRDSGMWDVVRIDHVLFAEDFEEDAIALLRAAREAEAGPPFALEPGESIVGPRLLLTPTKFELELPRRPLAAAQHRSWETWSITNARPSGDHASPTSGELRLSANIRRARAEGDVHTFNPAVVERFVNVLTTSSRPDEDAVRYLRGHLLPDVFRIAFEQSRNILLTLDQTTAPIPWEMFLIDPNSRSTAPSARFSMVRQLEDLRGGALPDVMTQSRALVVGPPNLSSDPALPELPRAVAEAEQVQALLRSHGYEVAPERSSGLEGDLIRRAHAKKEYSIVHLCGHGQVDEKDPSRTGLILANGDAFSSMDLRTWAAVPALVFFNCCHLGRTEKRLGYDHPQRLAASLAQACIQAGVRVVVAAGWAVNDAAAEAFSRTFYERMLAGEMFGAAVASARMDAWRTAPSSLTWAAYQCYGDPHFVLPRVATGGAQPNGTTDTPASRRELEDLLREMTLAAYRRQIDRSGDQVANEALTRRAEKAIRGVPDALWNGRLLHRMARLWDYLGKEELALPALALAATYPDAPLSLAGETTILNALRNEPPAARASGNTIEITLDTDAVAITGEAFAEVRTTPSLSLSGSAPVAVSSRLPSVLPATASVLGPLTELDRIAQRCALGEIKDAIDSLKRLEANLSVRTLGGIEALARPEYALILLLWPELRTVPAERMTLETVTELYRLALESAPHTTRTTAEKRIKKFGDLAPSKSADIRELRSRLPLIAAPDDPNKGQFGGDGARDGLKLSASFLPNQNDQGWVRFTLVVEPEDQQQTLTTPVTFHLHPTFSTSIVTVKPINNRAELSDLAWGAFTVGVEVGSTRLELDLAKHPDAPTPFRDR